MNLEDTAPMEPVCVAETGSPASETNPTRRPVSHRRKRSWWFLGRFLARRRERAELVEILETSDIEKDFEEVSLDDLLALHVQSVVPAADLLREWGFAPSKREVVDLPWPVVVPPRPGYSPDSLSFAIRILADDLPLPVDTSYVQCETVITTLVKYCDYCSTARTGKTMPNGQWRCGGCDILW